MWEWRPNMGSFGHLNSKLGTLVSIASLFAVMAPVG